MDEDNGNTLSEQQTLEKLGTLNEEFFRVATELHDAVASMDSGGSFTTDVEAVSNRVQEAVDSIDVATDGLLSFLSEINVADIPQKTLFCPKCGDQVEIERGDPGDPDYSGECPGCGWQWEICGIAPDETAEPDEPPGTPPVDAEGSEGGQGDGLPAEEAAAGEREAPGHPPEPEEI